MTAKTLYTKFVSVLASEKFFYVVMAVFVLQALWIALSGAYPMAFDEDFHLGIIQLYAGHPNPFLSHQPAGADAYGAVARDPSYLYHFIMSFVYRGLDVFTNSDTVIIEGLRVCSIAGFAASLVLFRRVLREVKLSKAVSHTVLLLLILIPIVPFLAAQINYDNLLLPLIAYALLLTIRVVRALQQHTIPIVPLSVLATLCLITSLVKYAFLPIFVAIVGYVLYVTFRAYAAHLSAIKKDVTAALRTVSKRTLVVVGILLVLSLGMFFQRYGHNIISYKNPIPACDKVLSQQECSAYGPWNRDHLYAQTKGGLSTSPKVFMHEWIYGLWFRSFFAVNGASSNFATRRPFPIPSKTVVALAIVGGAMVLVQGAALWRSSDMLRLAAVVTVVYLVTLCLQDFSYFHHTGRPVAINGRYIIPVLPLIFAWFAAAYSRAFRNANFVKPVLAVGVLVLMLQGGGVLTFILRSDNTWYMHNTTVIKVNNKAQNILKPWIIDDHHHGYL